MDRVEKVASWIVGLVTDHWLLIVLIGLPLALLITVAKLLVVVIRAGDQHWDPFRCKNYDPPIDIKKARRRQVGIPQLALPLVVIASVFVDTLLLTGWNWTVYWAIAIVWFVTAPIRKVWGIATARKAFAKAHPDREQATSLIDDIVDYWSWGFHSKTARLTGKYAKWNWLRIFLVLMRFWQLYGVALQAIASAFWFVSVLIAPFYHAEQIDDYDYWHQPWWRINRQRNMRPPARVIDGVATETVDGVQVRRTTTVDPDPTEPTSE